MGDHWIEAPKGSFVPAPGGVMHDFENRSSSRAGVLNFSIPGDFEEYAGDREMVCRESAEGRLALFRKKVTRK